MERNRFRIGVVACRLVLVAALSALSACMDSDAPAPPVSISATIGASGGTLNGPDGMQLVVPPGALDSDVVIRIARSSAGAPALPAGVPADQPVYEITPHGLQFAQPVQVRIPTAAVGGAQVFAWVTNPGEPWSTYPARVESGFLQVERLSLSFYSQGGYGLACTPVSGDPYPCRWGGMNVADPANPVTSTPAGALAVNVISQVSPTTGVTSIWRRTDVTQSAVLSVALKFSAPPDCRNGELQVFRALTPAGGLSQPAQRVAQQPIALAAPAPGSNEAIVGGIWVGSYTFTNAVSAAENGRLNYNFFFSCTRDFRAYTVPAYGFLDTIFVNIGPQVPGVAPTFTQMPANGTVIAGLPASFNAVAEGTPAPTIRWQVAPIAGAFVDVVGESGCVITPAPTSGTQTSASCVITNTLVGNTGQRYRAVANNSVAPGDVNSSEAMLTVSAAAGAPFITQHPAAQTASVGGTVAFNVVASGTAPFTYTWRLGGALPVVSGAFDQGTFSQGPCTGNVTYNNSGATVTLSNLTAGCDGLNASVVVSNNISPAATSNAALLRVVARPRLTSLPTSQAVDIGQTATFSVVATGVNLTYQWQRAGRNGFDPSTGESNYPLFSDIPAAISNSYTTPAATVADDFSRYAVLVCNGPALPGSANCTIYGAAEGVVLTINEVVSQNFSQVTSGTTAGLRSVAFATPSIGAAVGTGGIILRTTDGGQTWSPVASGTTADLRSVAFSGTGHGVITGGNGLLYTADNGASWAPTRPGDSGVCCIDVAFANATTAVMTYRDGYARSTDGGQTFTLTSPAQFFARARVRFGSALTGASADLLIKYTTDGGVTWSTATQPPNFGAQFLAFASSSVAVSSDGGSLVRTVNGGQTWTALYGGGFTRHSGALGFSTAGVGLSLGFGPSFGAMRTADHGQTWIPMTLPGFTGTGTTIEIHSLAFADANVVVAVGDNGTILRFTAGGL
jgi:photosystem II stability/assembly factor-like uncharacterized protein